MDHVCLRVEPFDQDAIVQHLESHGARVGEIRPRFGAQGESVSIYVYDPEDNLVELKGAKDVWSARESGAGRAVSGGNPLGTRV